MAIRWSAVVGWMAATPVGRPLQVAYRRYKWPLIGRCKLLLFVVNGFSSLNVLSMEVGYSRVRSRTNEMPYPGSIVKH